MTSTLNNDSLVKASFQRLLADLEFLHTNNMITNEAHATIHQTLEPTCHKLRIAKFFVTCTFTHEKKDAAQLHIQKGQVLEVLDDENTDWLFEASSSACLLHKIWLGRHYVEHWDREKLSKEDAGEIDSGDEVPVTETHQDSQLNDGNDADAEEFEPIYVLKGVEYYYLESSEFGSLKCGNAGAAQPS
ncbi:hypothetical protein FN846DRAFT_907860 [Sphaerosporella brunnea]|uniref:SH3 domain-containing protein n=1 Tax=Sphaerosporella brunnea TaxID=1250544 RepID=A0A5J5EVU2_9PEZI|nr:hypothetical protein FN846DRAFT_907860 [Sphaerosporella brunnea]